VAQCTAQMMGGHTSEPPDKSRAVPIARGNTSARIVDETKEALAGHV
jgi:hypothetical protein